MWVCKKCNEKIDDNFDSCWNCTEEFDSKELPDVTSLLEDVFKKEDRYLKLVKEIKMLENMINPFDNRGIIEQRIKFLKDQLKNI